MIISRKIALLLTALYSLNAETVHVGSQWQYKMPQEVSGIVKDGDTVVIDSGTYDGEVSIWRADNLTLKATGKYACIIAPAVIQNQKALWVIQGANTVIENIEFTKASVPDKNGAGIRAEGNNLIVRNCYFHDNENGILGGSGTVLVEGTVFERNGFGDGYSHNIYLGNNVTDFTFQYCYSHHAKTGHNLKSRAQRNFILYNRIMDEQDGNASYTIDLPNGGVSYIIGNLLQKGQKAENSTVITYGEEGLANSRKDCYIVNNTIINDRANGTFIRIQDGADTAIVLNNLFIGAGTLLTGPGKTTTNLAADSTALVDKKIYDYHLSANSPAIDQGSEPGSVNGVSLKPVFHYKHAVSFEPRIPQGKIDIGAYEYVTNSVAPAVKKSAPKSGSVTVSRYAAVIHRTPGLDGVCFFRLYDLNGRNAVSLRLMPGLSEKIVVPFTCFQIASGVYICSITDAQKAVIAIRPIVMK